MFLDFTTGNGKRLSNSSSGSRWQKGSEQRYARKHSITDDFSDDNSDDESPATVPQSLNKNQ